MASIGIFMVLERSPLVIGSIECMHSQYSNWDISDGIPYGLADFFFCFCFFSSFFRCRIWHSRRPNTMKETLH